MLLEDLDELIYWAVSIADCVDRNFCQGILQ